MERKETDVRTASEMIDRLKEAKVIDLDVSIGKVLSASLVTDIEKVAGYVLAWDKYVLVVGKEMESKVINI
jgi:hypothetical protein